MADVMLPVYLFSHTHEKDIACTDYYNAHHDDKIYLLPNCRYHIKLTGDKVELLEKVNSFRCNYQHVFIHSPSIVSVAKLLSGANKCLIMCRKQSTLKKIAKGTECPFLQEIHS